MPDQAAPQRGQTEVTLTIQVRKNNRDIHQGHVRSYDNIQ